MILRRLWVLLTMFALFHLSVATGNAACAAHSAEVAGAADTAAGATGHAEHGAAAAAHDAGREAGRDVPPAERCDMSSRAQCCEATVQCAVHGLASAEVRVSHALPESAVRIAAALDDAPASFAPAPEPPPPKA